MGDLFHCKLIQRLGQRIAQTGGQRLGQRLGQIGGQRLGQIAPQTGGQRFTQTTVQRTGQGGALSAYLGIIKVVTAGAT